MFFTSQMRRYFRFARCRILGSSFELVQLVHSHDVVPSSIQHRDFRPADSRYFLQEYRQQLLDRRMTG
jgi:hypothetical protein